MKRLSHRDLLLATVNPRNVTVMSPIAIDSPASSHAPAASLKPTPVAPTFHQTTESLAKNPLERTWRGNKEGTLRLKSVPDFGEDLLAKRQWIKEHMAGAFQFWGKLGYGEGVSGHITVRDPIKRDHYWMNPFAVHFSSITVSKLVLVGPDGYVAPEGAQLPINTADSAIHHARPTIQAAAHCHSLHGKAWSVFGKKIDILTQDSCLFYDNQAVYESFGGIALAAEEGANIAKALGPKVRPSNAGYYPQGSRALTQHLQNKACILQNHGLLTLGDTVDECAYLFSALENQCKAQLLVSAALADARLEKRVIEDEDARFTADTIQFWENTYINFQPEYELLVEEKGEKFLK
ncbi:hypothetical protein P7C70_g1836, partial [Phenoliferia sp. Uapishka_3]